MSEPSVNLPIQLKPQMLCTLTFWGNQDLWEILYDTCRTPLNKSNDYDILVAKDIILIIIVLQTVWKKNGYVKSECYNCHKKLVNVIIVCGKTVTAGLGQ